jgi:hypothetical protein
MQMNLQKNVRLGLRFLVKLCAAAPLAPRPRPHPHPHPRPA